MSGETTVEQSKRRFDEHYSEVLALGDGTEVELRPIRPTDKKALREGFERLSPASRQMRFFGVKNNLSDTELKQLTEVDGEDHFALVAVRRYPDGRTEGVGVARFARHADRPEVAEPAITVVDGAQGRGLGSMLLRRLTAAAAERGVEQFHCEFLSHNERIRRMLLDQSRATRFEEAGEYIRAEVPITGGEPGEPRPTLFELLGHSARGALEQRVERLLLKIRT